MCRDPHLWVDEDGRYVCRRCSLQSLVCRCSVTFLLHIYHYIPPSLSTPHITPHDTYMCNTPAEGMTVTGLVTPFSSPPLLYLPSSLPSCPPSPPLFPSLLPSLLPPPPPPSLSPLLRAAWRCSHCGNTYDMPSIEQCLIDAVQRRSMAFVLQDLVCSKCHQVRGWEGKGRADVLMSCVVWCGALDQSLLLY